MPIENSERVIVAQPVDGNQSVGEELWQGMQRGSKDELQYDKEHYLDSAVRVSLAAGVGYLTTDIYKAGGASAKVAILPSLVISGVHWCGPEHLEDVKKRVDGINGTAERVGYFAGRFGTDAAMTMAIATGANRANWTKKGDEMIDHIVGTDSFIVRHSPARNFRGGLSRGRSVEHPVYRQHRGEDLADFLIDHGQPERLKLLLPRLTAKGEPNIRIRQFDSYGMRDKGNMPEFDPAKLLERVRGAN